MKRALAAVVALAAVALNACPRPDFNGRPCTKDSDCVDQALVCTSKVCRIAEGEAEGEGE